MRITTDLAGFNIGNGNVPGGFFSGLGEGTYAVTVTDANGCTASGPSIVLNGAATPPARRTPKR